jgi:hypothetical protein
MDTQNVSAQLYFKQLPTGNSASPTQSSSELENAFQKQLDLSEFYKGKDVFEKVKNEFMDQTEEGIGDNEVPPMSGLPQQLPEPPPKIIEDKPIVGPTDFLNRFIKEGFGKTTLPWWQIVLMIIGAILGSIGLLIILNSSPKKPFKKNV